MTSHESKTTNLEEKKEEAREAPDSGIGWANEVDATSEQSERAEK